MAKEVIMPKQGLQMTEGTILQWFYSEGDAVKEGEPLFEIETDKLTIEIESPATGTLLKIIRQVDEVVPITEIIGVIGEKGEDISSFLGNAPSSDAVSQPQADEQQNDTVDTDYQYDVVVIGGGPGGYTAAIAGAKEGLKIALVENDLVGGTCLNRGCIPTKTLIHSAALLNESKTSAQFGISHENTKVDWAKVIGNKDKVVKKLRKGVEGLLKANKVTLYRGFGKIENPNKVVIEGDDYTSISTKNIIVATGSEPIIMNIPGTDLPGVITSEDALELKEIPKSMVIIGGGVIGIELAYVYQSFGTDITIIEMMPEILPREDAEVVETLKRTLKKNKIKVLTGTKFTKVAEADNQLEVSYESAEDQGRVLAEKVLLSVGRKAITSATDQVSLAMDRGNIVIDSNLRTNIPNIYAIGDATGKVMLAHVASAQAEVAIQNICGENVAMDYTIIPSCIYCAPEIASVGLTEKEAKEKFGSVKIGKFPFSACGRAMTSGETEGFIKVVVNEKWNEIVGVHIIGPSATELIAEAALALKLECTVEEVSDTIHAHPTLAESFMEAAMNANGKAIHIP